MTQKVWIISGFVAIMVCALAPVILNFIITHVYTKYIGVDLKGGGGYMYFMLLALTLGAGVLLLSKDELINKPDVNLWVKMMLIAATMQIFSFTMGYFFRLVILYSVAIIVFIPIVINKLRGSSKVIARIVICLMLFGYYLFELTHDTLSLVPYAWRL
jgi:membrane protein